MKYLSKQKRSSLGGRTNHGGGQLYITRHASAVLYNVPGKKRDTWIREYRDRDETGGVWPKNRQWTVRRNVDECTNVWSKQGL